jgi:hypothetical protein
MVICLQIPQCFESVEELLLSIIECTWVNNVRQTTKSLVSEPSYFEVEIAIEKLKSINSQVLIKFCQNIDASLM